jgi:hypothetical protein
VSQPGKSDELLEVLGDELWVIVGNDPWFGFRELLVARCRMISMSFSVMAWRSSLWSMKRQQPSRMQVQVVECAVQVDEGDIDMPVFMRFQGLQEHLPVLLIFVFQRFSRSAELSTR